MSKRLFVIHENDESHWVVADDWLQAIEYAEDELGSLPTGTDIREYSNETLVTLPMGPDDQDEELTLTALEWTNEYDYGLLYSTTD
jgi:hypothetical protein